MEKVGEEWGNIGEMRRYSWFEGAISGREGRGDGSVTDVTMALCVETGVNHDEWMRDAIDTG